MSEYNDALEMIRLIQGTGSDILQCIADLAENAEPEYRDSLMATKAKAEGILARMPDENSWAGAIRVGLKECARQTAEQAAKQATPASQSTRGLC